MILSNYKEFLDQIVKKLDKLGMNTIELKIDHIGYQASSDKDYDEKKEELIKLGKIKHDVQVGDRRVAIFKLFKPLQYKNQTFSAVEIVSPKKDQQSQSAWEHVEIVPDEGLEAFMKKYPDLFWDTNAIDRDIFPMLTLKIEDNTRAKFPRRPVLVEVERIKTEGK